MEGVDTVLALIRGVQDLDVLAEAAAILQVEIQGLEGDRRRLLREISNFIDSDDFTALGVEANNRIIDIQGILNAHFLQDMPHLERAPGAMGGDEAPPLAEAVGGQVGVNADAAFLQQLDPFHQEQGQGLAIGPPVAFNPLDQAFGPPGLQALLEGQELVLGQGPHAPPAPVHDPHAPPAPVPDPHATRSTWSSLMGVNG